MKLEPNIVFGLIVTTKKTSSLNSVHLYNIGYPCTPSRLHLPRVQSLRSTRDITLSITRNKTLPRQSLTSCRLLEVLYTIFSFVPKLSNCCRAYALIAVVW